MHPVPLSRADAAALRTGTECILELSIEPRPMILVHNSHKGTTKSCQPLGPTSNRTNKCSASRVHACSCYPQAEASLHPRKPHDAPCSQNPARTHNLCCLPQLDAGLDCYSGSLPHFCRDNAASAHAEAVQQWSPCSAARQQYCA